MQPPPLLHSFTLSLSRTFCTVSSQLPELLSLYFHHFCTKTARVLLGQAVCDREKSIYHRCLTEMELERKRGRDISLYSFCRLLIVYILLLLGYRDETQLS